jgi:hypothetical protein
MKSLKELGITVDIRCYMTNGDIDAVFKLGPFTEMPDEETISQIVENQRKQMEEFILSAGATGINPLRLMTPEEVLEYIKKEREDEATANATVDEEFEDEE